MELDLHFYDVTPKNPASIKQGSQISALRIFSDVYLSRIESRIGFATKWQSKE